MQFIPLKDTAPARSGRLQFIPLAPSQTEPENPSLLESAKGVGEGVLAVASGITAPLIGGAAGIYGAARNALGFGDQSQTPSQAALEASQSAARAVTYEPRTPVGKAAVGAFDVAKPILEFPEKVGRYVERKTGSPTAGAAAETALQAIPYLAPALIKGKAPALAERANVEAVVPPAEPAPTGASLGVATKPLALPNYAHEPMVSFPDGSVGTLADAKIAEQTAFKTKYAPQPTEPKAQPYTLSEPPSIEGKLSFIPLKRSNAPNIDIKAALEKPGFQRNAEEVSALKSVDPDAIEAAKIPGFQRTAEQVSVLNKASSNTLGFLGGGQLKQATEALGQTYLKYAGRPLYEYTKANPGTTGAIALGATAGFNSQDEDASFTSKLLGAGIGATLGFGIAKSTGKIPAGSGTLADTLSKLFINNYGLPADYVKAKASQGMYANSIQSKFVDLAQEASTLPANGRRTLYNILQGEAPQTADLAVLTKAARDQITETGQKLVDYGLLSKETFEKNAATYLHRDYTSKLKPSDTFTLAARKLRLIGNELKPRGVIISVDENQVPNYLAKGYELFGKARNGAQQLRIQLTKAQRQQLGEIEDGAYAIAKTGSLMGNDIATFKFFDDLSKNPKIAADAPVNPEWVQISTDKIPKTGIARYGNLAGKFVPPEVAADLKMTQLARDISNLPGISAYLKLNSLWKISKTALNPVVHTNNIMSNIVLYDLTGANFRELPNAVMELRAAAKGDLSPFYKQAKELGVFDANFAAIELRSLSKSHLDSYMQLENAGTSPLDVATRIARAAWQKSAGKLIDYYQKEDNVFRLGVFQDAVKKGVDPETAALKAKKAFVDYDINAPGINAMRNTVTPFIAYTYGVVPRLAEAAALRPWKFAKWAAIGYGLNTLGTLYGGGNEKQERALLPQQHQGSLYGIPGAPPQSIKLPLQIGGIPQYQDITRFVPGGDVLDISGEGQAIPGLPASLQPSGGIAGSLAQAAFGYDAFKRQKLPGLGLGNLSDAKIKGKFLAQQLLPNFPGVPGAYSTQKIADAVKGNPAGALGTRIPTAQALLQSIGIKVFPADINQLKGQKLLELKQRLDAIQELARVVAVDYQRGRIDQKEYESQMKNYNEQAAQYFEKAAKIQ